LTYEAVHPANIYHVSHVTLQHTSHKLSTCSADGARLCCYDQARWQLVTRARKFVCNCIDHSLHHFHYNVQTGIAVAESIRSKLLSGIGTDSPPDSSPDSSLDSSLDSSPDSSPDALLLLGRVGWYVEVQMLKVLERHICRSPCSGFHLALVR